VAHQLKTFTPCGTTPVYVTPNVEMTPQFDWPCRMTTEATLVNDVAGLVLAPTTTISVKATVTNKRDQQGEGFLQLMLNPSGVLNSR
jgi:hypothetical protein